MDIEIISSIQEYASAMYPDGVGEIPQEVLEACELEVLYEARKAQVQVKVLLNQLFQSYKGQEWTTDKIDKEIRKIEKCNKIIDEAQKKSFMSPKYLKLLSSATYWEDLIERSLCTYIGTKGINKVVGKVFGNKIGAAAAAGVMNIKRGMAFDNMDMTITGLKQILATSFAAALPAQVAKNTFNITRNYAIKEKDNGKKHLVRFEMLRKENEKALEWLKKERERVASGTAKKKKLGDIITGKQESTIFDNVEII